MIQGLEGNAYKLQSKVWEQNQKFINPFGRINNITSILFRKKIELERQ